MSCNQNKNNTSCCSFNLKSFGVYDFSRVTLDGRDRTQLNWNEVSIPEILSIPEQKPDIEHLDQVYVDAKINCYNLIETPYAYKTYERLANVFEVSAAISAINLAVVDISPILDAIKTILSIPLLPDIPQVVALQAALVGVTTAAANLTQTINNALVALDAPCILASVVVELLNAVSLAISVLEAALALLISAANALVAAVAAIPIVGPAVAAAVKVLLDTINAIVQELLNSVQAILGAITLIGNTTYFSLIPNEEGTCLSGRKLIIEGTLKQKVVYTGLVTTQSVHSVHNEIPFTAYIIPYAKFEGLNYVENITVSADPAGDPCETITINGFPYDPENPPVVDLCEEFCVNGYVEDIFAYAIDCRTVFKNITLFLLAKPKVVCS